jgi:hypothetical protein
MASFTQVRTPNWNIACAPGWCLQYVRQAFGLPAHHPTATAAWDASTSKHRDQAFPAGVWLPLWFAVKGVPAGHVVLRAPNGNIYSTTTPNKYTPTFHPNLAHLMKTYADAGLPLTYLGWTEDVAGYSVVAPKPVPKVVAAVKKIFAKKYWYVTLPPSAGTWGVYKMGVPPVSKNIFARLNPGKYGPLTYRIEHWVQHPNVAAIKTQQLGMVQIYVAPGTGARIFQQ